MSRGQRAKLWPPASPHLLGVKSIKYEIQQERNREKWFMPTSSLSAPPSRQIYLRVIVETEHLMCAENYKNKKKQKERYTRRKR